LDQFIHNSIRALAALLLPERVATARVLCRGFLQVGEIDLDRALRYAEAVESKIIIAGPNPFLRLFHQAFSHRIPMHICEPVAEFLSVSDKAIPKLVLPE
jgi:hypothetical protein